MQLLDYLKLKGQTVTDFAAEVHERLGARGSRDTKVELSTTVTRVSRHASGHRAPSLEDIAVYDELTKGAVTPADWVALAVQQKHPPDETAEPAAASG